MNPSSALNFEARSLDDAPLYFTVYFELVEKTTGLGEGSGVVFLRASTFSLTHFLSVYDSRQNNRQHSIFDMLPFQDKINTGTKDPRRKAHQTRVVSAFAKTGISRLHKSRDKRAINDSERGKFITM